MAVKHRLEFKDIYNVTWKVDFDFSGYSGEVLEMESTEDPIIIEYLNSSDEINQNPIRGSRALINIYANSNFQYNDFFDADELEISCLVYYNSTLFWKGFLIPGNHSELYNGIPYPIQISCSDGLGLLSDIDFDDEGTPYNGRLLESEIILNILNKIGYSEFSEIVNLFENAMEDDVDNSPMDQIKIDVDLFLDMTCYDVLSHILNKYNSVIIQSGGKIVIYRPSELVNSTVYKRTFTTAISKTAESFLPDQYFNRKTIISDFNDVEGGMLLEKRPSKKVTIRQDYGYKDSFLDNWNFLGNSFHITGLLTYTCDFWTKADSCVIAPISYFIPGESSGIVLSHQNSYPTLSKYIYQYFGSFIIESATDFLGLSFDYQWLNQSGTGASGMVFYFSIEDSAGTNFLVETDENFCEWAGSGNIFVSENILNGNNGWKNWERRITGFPVAGEYIIKIYSLDSTYTDIYLAINNIKFIVTSDSITVNVIRTPKKISLFGIIGYTWNKITYETNIDNNEEIVGVDYVKSNSITGIDLNYSHILGDVDNTEIDNVLEQFKGALSLSLRDSLEDSIDEFITDYASDYNPGGVNDVLLSHGVGIHSVDLIFTAETPGEDFSGSTSITNTSGNLGVGSTVVNTRANYEGVKQKDYIAVTGTSGTANFQCNSLTRLATFSGSLSGTAANFVSTWASDFLAAGVVITQGGFMSEDKVFFEELAAEGGFSVLTTVTQVTGDLNGIVWDEFVSPDIALSRIDTITISGYYGTADILCNGITREIILVENSAYSSAWHTRGGTEDKPLREIIGDEIAAKRNRTTMILSNLPIIEGKRLSDLPQINLLGNFQDNLNKISGTNRKFVFNRGSFDIRNREWNLDLIEIIPIPES